MTNALSSLRTLMRGTVVARVYRAVKYKDLPPQFVASSDDSRKKRDYFRYFNNTALVETHYGSHLLLDLEDLSLTPTIIKTGWWEPWNDILLRSLLKPGMNYLNAGANFGYHTMLGALLVEHTGRVFAFEPDPNLFHLLKRSTFINGFSPRVTLYRAAVYDMSGESDFLFVTEHQGGSGLGDTDRAYLATGNPAPETEFDEFGKSDPGIWTRKRMVKVKRVTIDETVGESIKALNVLHMDIERSEGPAILGARSLIARSPDLKIIIEHPGFMPDEVARKYLDAVDFLIAQAFKFCVIRPSGNVYDNPPSLEPVAASDLANLPHCDLYISRD